MGHAARESAWGDRVRGSEYGLTIAAIPLMPLCLAVDYQTFVNILHRPNGFKPAGTPGEFIDHSTVS